MGEINVIILYQVAIFAIIILSSFAGFKGLFISVCLIVGFSLSNIFTAKLLVIQFTTSKRVTSSLSSTPGGFKNFQWQA